MKPLKENKKRIAFVFLGLLAITGCFYWFQLRPVYSRKACIEEAMSNTTSKSVKDRRYRECLAKHGVKPEPLFEEAENISATEPNFNDIEDGIKNRINDAVTDLEITIEEQNKEQNKKIKDEFQNKANCESLGGTYRGGGLCTYY